MSGFFFNSPGSETLIVSLFATRLLAVSTGLLPGRALDSIAATWCTTLGLGKLTQINYLWIVEHYSKIFDTTDVIVTHTLRSQEDKTVHHCTFAKCQRTIY